MPVLIPPGAPTGAFSDGKIRGNATDLWRFYGFSQGLAIVKSQGAWRLEPTVVLDEVDEFFQGGMKHIIDDSKAAELTAAGFGEYIDALPPDPGGTTDPTGYGQGAYGAGPYGA